MSPSPINNQDKKAVDQYTASWQAIMQQVRRGSSWSGYERNCSFLNTGGTFVSASHVSGLDFSDDGRGLAVTDWDQDGDLDLWFRNRTAPRLRLMLNQSASADATRHLAFRLEGTKSNRDAIGAVVELQLEGSDQRLVRSVRAGEMFLSQSSKWVHFGLPANATVTNVKVLWPGGQRSTYENIEAGKRYLLVQGEAAASPSASKRRVTLPTAPLPTVTTSAGEASLVLAASARLPIGSYNDERGIAVSMPVAQAPKLILLWSADCAHCRKELTQLARSAPPVDILALCVDGISPEAQTSAHGVLVQAGYTGAWGMIGAEAVERIHVLQEALFDSTPEFAVPFSMLVRPGNEIVAIYRGEISNDVIAADLKSAVPASDAQLRDLAPPFPGRWFTLPADPAFLPNLIARRIEERYPEDALTHLEHAAEKSFGEAKRKLLTELGRKHYSLADNYAKKKLFRKSDFHFLKTLQALPDNPSVHNDFGSSLASRGRYEEGAYHFAEALRLKPDFPLAKSNLAKAQRLLEQSNQ